MSAGTRAAMAACMTTDLAAFKSDHRWQRAFSIATAQTAALPARTVEPPRLEDVAEITHMRFDESEECPEDEYHPSGEDWRCVGRMNDGTWFALTGGDRGCATCGFDQETEIRVGESFDIVVRMGLDEWDRARLDIKLDINVSPPVS